MPDYAPETVAKQTGIAADTITRLAHEIAAAESGAVVIAGAPLAQTNGMFNALAVNALEALVESGHSSPILSFTPQPPIASAVPDASHVQAGLASLSALSQAVLKADAHAPKALLLYDANPVFGAPPNLQFREAIAKIPYIVSFGSFVDETSAYADLILPDQRAARILARRCSESGPTQSVASLAPPAVHPLAQYARHAGRLAGCRPTPRRAMSPPPCPGKLTTLCCAPLTFPCASTRVEKTAPIGRRFLDEDDTSRAAGGARRNRASVASTAATAHAPAKFADAQFDGAAQDFPFYFLPYPSQSFRDGSLAHLPWLQEMPDVLTTAMWSSWVEINPKTAEQLHIGQGDLVESPRSTEALRAPAILSPGIAPDVIAMPMGQGHENFGRFASGRGANPLSILASLTEPETGRAGLGCHARQSRPRRRR